MFDELEALRSDPHLLLLLEHYARAGADDRESWQDRVMKLNGVAASALVRLHGDLLASDWIEQNTGVTPGLQSGAVPSCYRLTSAGRSILRRAEGSFTREESDEE